MKYTLPHTIQNCIGDTMIFQSVEPTAEGDKVMIEAFSKSGCGPAMHTHFLQDEELTVISGKLGFQILGQEAQYANAGETVFFKRGTPHRFWAEGREDLHCNGWIQPSNTIVFFLSAIYAAQNKSGKAKPETFDGAYLQTKYADEYDMPEIPVFVRKVISPITYFIGRLLGKYEHFKDAPPPITIKRH
jgi:quercetin dioxygenase-like cupin family protein